MERLRRSAREIEAVAARHRASNIRVFGSVVRRDADSTSDVDLLVDLDPDRRLFDLGSLLMDLTDLLGTEVDVVTESSLNSRVRLRVLAEAVPLQSLGAPWAECHLGLSRRSGLSSKSVGSGRRIEL